MEYKAGMRVRSINTGKEDVIAYMLSKIAPENNELVVLKDGGVVWIGPGKFTPEVELVEEEIPEKWAVEVTPESVDSLEAWRKVLFSPARHLVSGYMDKDKFWYNAIQEGYTLISFEQFKQIHPELFIEEQFKKLEPQDLFISQSKTDDNVRNNQREVRSVVSPEPEGQGCCRYPLQSRRVSIRPASGYPSDKEGAVSLKLKTSKS